MNKRSSKCLEACAHTLSDGTRLCTWPDGICQTWRDEYNAKRKEREEKGEACPVIVWKGRYQYNCNARTVDFVCEQHGHFSMGAEAKRVRESLRQLQQEFASQQQEQK
jgi:hypothetical protein